MATGFPGTTPRRRKMAGGYSSVPSQARGGGFRQGAMMSAPPFSSYADEQLTAAPTRFAQPAALQTPWNLGTGQSVGGFGAAMPRLPFAQVPMTERRPFDMSTSAYPPSNQNPLAGRVFGGLTNALSAGVGAVGQGMANSFGQIPYQGITAERLAASPADIQQIMVPRPATTISPFGGVNEMAQGIEDQERRAFDASPEGLAHRSRMELLQRNTDAMRAAAGKHVNPLTGQWTDEGWTPQEEVSLLGTGPEAQRYLDRPEMQPFVQKQLGQNLRDQQAKEAEQIAALRASGWGGGGFAQPTSTTSAGPTGTTGSPSPAAYTPGTQEYFDRTGRVRTAPVQPPYGEPGATPMLGTGGDVEAFKTHRETAKAMRDRSTISDMDVRKAMVQAKAQGRPISPFEARMEVKFGKGETPTLGEWVAGGLPAEAHPDIFSAQQAMQQQAALAKAIGTALSNLPENATPEMIQAIIQGIREGLSMEGVQPFVPTPPVASTTKRPSRTSPAFRPQATRVPAGAGIMPITRPGPGFTMPRNPLYPSLGRMEGA